MADVRIPYLVWTASDRKNRLGAADLLMVVFPRAHDGPRSGLLVGGALSQGEV